MDCDSGEAGRRGGVTGEKGKGKRRMVLVGSLADLCVIGSLCCESAEEAKTLIPSLVNKITDVDLQDLLDEISKLRNFTEG